MESIGTVVTLLTKRIPILNLRTLYLKSIENCSLRESQLSSIISSLYISDTTIIDTLKVLLISGNDLTSKVKEQAWQASINAFPNAIISCEENISTSDCLTPADYFLNIIKSNGKSQQSEYKILAVAIEYLNLLNKNKNDFIELCERQEGYFTGVDNVELIKSNTYVEEVIGLVKIFGKLIVNYEVLNGECNPLEALAIILRINIRVNGTDYKATTEKIKFVVEDSLNYHDAYLNID